MRRFMPFLAVAAALAACQERGITLPEEDLQLSASVARPAHRVIGGGSIVREDIAGSPRETYGFQAQVDAAGKVTGEAEVHFPSDVVKMHIAVQCLVVERNRAWLSGPVTRSDDPETPVGRVFLWQVQDNGQGQGAPPDRISNVIHRPADNYPPDACRWKPALTTFPCDNGNVTILTPGMRNLADLVGTWDATVLYFINPVDPTDSVSLSEGGGQLRWTVAPDGRWTQIWWTPEAIFENTAGALDLINGTLTMWADGDPSPVPITCAGGRVTGERITMDCLVEAGYDWDGNGSDDPSRVVGEFRRKHTGVLIDDLAGTWVATVFRLTSLTDPALTVEFVAQGATITMTVRLDSRFFLHIEPDGWTSTTDWLLLDGDRLLTRSREGEVSSGVFSLARGTWTASIVGGLDYDFDGDGTPEPARVDMVMVRN
jgi:hypothetical protein